MRVFAHFIYCSACCPHAYQIWPKLLHYHKAYAGLVQNLLARLPNHWHHIPKDGIMRHEVFHHPLHDLVDQTHPFWWNLLRIHNWLLIIVLHNCLCRYNLCRLYIMRSHTVCRMCVEPIIRDFRN